MKTFLLILVTGLIQGFLARTINAQWEQANGPYGGFINCIAVNEPSVFAGTYNQGIYRSIDYGETWTAVNYGITEKSINTLLIRNTDIFAGTASGAVFLSTDNGSNWRELGNGLHGKPVSSLVITGSTLFAGTSEGVYLSTDTGTNWAPANHGLGNTHVTALFVLGTDLYAGTTDSIYKSVNSGTSWSPASSGLPNARITAFAANGASICAATYGSGIYLSPDKGDSWTPVNHGLTYETVLSLAFHGSVLFAGTSNGIFRSDDIGENWNPAGLQHKRIDCLSVLVNRVFAGTPGEGMMVTTNDGSTWEPLDITIADTRVNTFASKGTYLFAGTNGSGIFRSPDQGETWSAVNAGLIPKEINALSTLGDYLFAGAGGGYVFRSSDYGDTWENASNGLPPGQTISSLCSHAAYLFAGTPHGIYRSSDGGDNWMKSDAGMPDVSVKTVVSTGTNLYAGTWGSGIYYSTDHGENWNPANTGLLSLYINDLEVQGTNLFAGTAYSGVFLSADHGSHWGAVNTGLPGKSAEALAVNGTTLFVALLQKGIFFTINNGERWSDISSGWTNYQVNTFTADDTYLLAGTEREGVWRRKTCSVNTETDTNNILENGDFESCILLPWYLYKANYLGVNATAEPEDGACKVSGITLAAEPATWHVQLNQSLTPAQLSKLEKGCRYELSFNAYALNQSRQCRVTLEQDAEPYANLLEKTFTINTQTTNYSYDFSVDTVFIRMKLTFQPGLDTPSFVIDNVMLKKKSAVAVSVPGIVQAEEYSSMAGIQTEPATDAGSGLNVAYIDQGDWMEYLISVPETAPYTIGFRVASLYGGQFVFAQNGVNQSAITVPNTGGWQTWTTIKTNVNLTTGVQTIRLTANTGGWNINWWQVEAAASVSVNPEAIDEIAVYPNPVSGILTIVAKKGSKWRLTNSMGLLIKEGYVENSQVLFDTSGLSKGIYILEIAHAEKRIAKTIIVQ